MPEEASVRKAESEELNCVTDHAARQATDDHTGHIDTCWYLNSESDYC